MVEEARRIDPGFSTADAESVSLLLRKRTGILEFTDWREHLVKVTLENVVALKWQEADSSGPEDRDDLPYEIANSEWLRKHLAQHIVAETEGHKHYKFCFNAAGILEVICSGIRVEKA
jgi:hypothetical protein